ncbi:hypothetical protein HAX54_022745 [Datura stramonium]|uniref:Uncharacterized protein n=1 Tax=Datura stramonium TaxID=4076 RepID=A0ABS8Y4E4_DATST|nr:hypothetical protein [Datura stramonium]
MGATSRASLSDAASNQNPTLMSSRVDVIQSTYRGEGKGKELSTGMEGFVRISYYLRYCFCFEKNESQVSSSGHAGELQPETELWTGFGVSFTLAAELNQKARQNRSTALERTSLESTAIDISSGTSVP